jgi:transposase
MGTPSCTGCRQRDQTIAVLRQRLHAAQARIRQLEAKLGRNATNSSVPPSANPPGVPKLSPKKATRHPSGGHPGHPARLWRRLPPERVQHFHDFVPSQYWRCREWLPSLPTPDDPEPTWHQVAELPKLATVFTEHRSHFRTCPRCGTLNHASLPAELKAHSIGPRFAVTLSHLTGLEVCRLGGMSEECR